MQKKTVVIDGVEFGRAVHNGIAVMWQQQIAAIHSLKEKNVSNAYYNHTSQFREGVDTLLLNIDECKKASIPADRRPRRVFTATGYDKICQFQHIKGSMLYYDTIETYFGVTDTLEVPKVLLPIDRVVKTSKEIQASLASEEVFRPGVELPPIEIKAKPIESEDDEVLNIAIRIVADRQKMKHLEEENAELKARIDAFTSAIKAWM